MSTTIRDNPFATRFVRPGAIGYRFAGAQQAQHVIARLRSNGWWGQIVGPHGSGKSTLLATLRPELQRAGRAVVWFPADGRCRAAWPLAKTDGPWSSATQVVVDGYEQLGRMTRWRLRNAVRRAGAGLLATAHAPVGLPELVRIEPNLETVRQIVRDLIGPEPTFIDDDAVNASFTAQQGNVREVFFDLYNLCERCRG